MTDNSSQRSINVSITERDNGTTVAAADLGIEVSAATRGRALREFDTELTGVLKILAEKGFQPPQANDKAEKVTESAPQTQDVTSKEEASSPSQEEVDMPPKESPRTSHTQVDDPPTRRRSFSIQRLPVFWQSVLFVLFLLFAINQLLLVPALDRFEKVTSAIVGKDGTIPATHQVGRIMIDHIIELSKASDQVTPERRRELIQALKRIAVNSKPFFEALQPAYQGLTEQEPPQTDPPESDQRPGTEPNR